MTDKSTPLRDHDPLLAMLVSLSDSEGKDSGVSLTLYVGGTAFSGALVAARAYGRAIAEGLDDPQAFAELFPQPEKVSLDQPPRYIHMRDVVITPGLATHAWWRCRLAAVDAFTFATHDDSR